MFNKIKNLKELKTILKKKKFVLAHGVFDIFHIGHKRHLENAKSYADFLVVSITTDKFVKKGPNRPIFNSMQRAELISSLEAVDYVYINNDETPVHLIKEIKPNFYIKGNDYSNLKKDLTGNIYKEKKATENGGGELIISNEIEFSSSNLINNYFKPTLILSEIKKNEKNLNLFRNECIKSIKKIKDLKIAVIGEIIFDEYLISAEMGKPSKENIFAVEFKTKKTYLGGSFAIAKQLSKLSKNVTLFTSGKFNSEQSKLLNDKLNTSKNLKVKRIKSDFKNIIKSRYITSENKKMFDVYKREGNSDYLDPKNLIKDLKISIKNYDLVLISDFGHGFFSKELYNIILKNSKYLCINTQTNAGNRGYNLITKYKKANMVALDEPEIRLALKNKTDPIKKVTQDLFKIMKVEKIVVTLGKKGILVFSKNSKNKIKSFKLSAFETNPIDTIGAGDAVFGIASALAVCKSELKIISFISNLLGAMTTNIVGHEKSIEKNEILKALNYSLK